MESKLPHYKVTRELGNLAYRHLEEDWGEVPERRHLLNTMAIEAKQGVAVSIFMLEGVMVKAVTVFDGDKTKTTIAETRVKC